MVKEIKVCMGSACFAKGNLENLEYIREYIDDNNLDSEIMIVGALCENKCSDGPRIIVDGVEYTNITKEKITELLRS
jgi:NADH:ubiquinone oxidoreductase subunit E